MSLSKEKPDAIFTDYYMAGGDGHYLLSWIKSTPATKHIPVIVCSGNMRDAKARMPVERALRGRGGAADFSDEAGQRRNLTSVAATPCWYFC